MHTVHACRAFVTGHKVLIKHIPNRITFVLNNQHPPQDTFSLLCVLITVFCIFFVYYMRIIALPRWVVRLWRRVTGRRQ